MSSKLTGDGYSSPKNNNKKHLKGKSKTSLRRTTEMFYLAPDDQVDHDLTDFNTPSF